MPMSKAGRKIKVKLKEQYGEKKGEGIFYAMENKGEIPGMNKKTGYNVGGQVSKQPNQRQTQQMAAFNRSQERAMNASRQTPAGPGGMQARQASSASARQPQVGAMQAKQANEAKLLATRPTQAGSMQARQAAAARRRQAQTPNTPDTTTNQRNMALAQRNMAAKTQGTPAPKTPRRNMNPLSNRRGFAEGGMVKSTGKLDTGIKKCGE